MPSDKEETISVEVLCFGRFRELAARQSIAFLEPGARLADLIEWLVKEYGADFQQEMNQAGEPRILINGQYHDLLGKMEAPLKDGDVVAILPLAIGG